MWNNVCLSDLSKLTNWFNTHTLLVSVVALFHLGSHWINEQYTGDWRQDWSNRFIHSGRKANELICVASSNGDGLLFSEMLALSLDYPWYDLNVVRQVLTIPGYWNDKHWANIGYIVPSRGVNHRFKNSLNLDRLFQSGEFSKQCSLWTTLLYVCCFAL
jgi:hypothetical protein